MDPNTFSVNSYSQLPGPCTSQEFTDGRFVWNQYFQYTAVGHLIILFLGSQRLSSKGRKERIFWRVVFFFFYIYSYATV